MGRAAVMACVLMVMSMCVVAVCFTAQTAVSRAAAGGAESVRLPVLMYHDVYEKARRYSVTPERLDADLDALERAGYEYVSPAMVSAYAEGRGDLPERPVMLTFDDGHYNNLSHALPVLERHNACATFCVVGAFADKYSLPDAERDVPAYSCMTWEEIADLPDLITVAAHSYDMHSLGKRRGVLPREGESDAAYRAALTADADKLLERFKNIGISTDVYAYPYGFYRARTREILRDVGFKVFLTCGAHVNTLVKGDPSALDALARFSLEGSYTDRHLLDLID